MIVDIDDQQHREKYIEVLDKSGLKYSIMESGKIYIDIDSAETLKGKMKDYYEWREARTRELNKQLRLKENR